MSTNAFTIKITSNDMICLIRQSYNIINLENVTIMYTVVIVVSDRFQRSALSGLCELFHLTNFLLKKKRGKSTFNVVIASLDGKIVQDHLSQKISNIILRMTDLKHCDSIIFLGTMPSYEKDLSVNLLNKIQKDWIIQNHNKSTLIASMFSGTFFLAEAGILNNKKFNLYTEHKIVFSQKHSFLKPNSSTYIHRDKNIVTSSGIMSWLDISIEIIDDALGEEANILLSELSIHGSSQKTSRKKPLKKANTFLSKAQNIIMDTENINITPQKLASLMPVSERTLARRIKQYTDKTPKQLIDDFRIEKACKLLATTDKQIKEIAFLSGYNSDIAFRRSFTKKMKINPSKYRETTFP